MAYFQFPMNPIKSRLIVLFVMAALPGHVIFGKDKRHKSPAQPQDQIVVNAHIAVPQGVIAGFEFTRHYNRRYVYAQRTGEPPLLIDITRLDAPKVLSTLAASGDAGSGNLLAVAGTAVVASDAAPATDTPKARTIRIIDYSDTTHPKVTNEFKDVTAIANQGGLILLANPDGIWILSQKLAEDPEEEAEYARRVVYQ